MHNIEQDGRYRYNYKQLLQRKNISNSEWQLIFSMKYHFIDDKFEYALYAPDKSKRWILKEYNCTDEDIAFAGRFIEWNTVTHGIQRVDACRTKDGELLLVELKDLNPYLSILDVNEIIRHKFLNDMMETLEKL